MVLPIQVAVLVELLQLLFPYVFVHFALILLHELGIIPFASVFNAQNMLIRQQNMNYMLPLLGVVAQDLDGLVVQIVDVNGLKVHLRHI